ncbi:Metallo-dependent phosphatase-like protein [Lactarius hatsudake]|nr:Metallo-dependent phosphatase-like protein [Lactarius hatsudake]
MGRAAPCYASQLPWFETATDCLALPTSGHTVLTLSSETGGRRMYHVGSDSPSAPLHKVIALCPSRQRPRDFASFVAHMKKIADEKGVDLLLVDSGDLHDGTNLSDGFPLGGIDAHDSNQFFSQLLYDVPTIGNHELYIYANALDMHQNFAPKFPGRYLSSDVNITIPGKIPAPNGSPVSVPVGSRFAKFKTRK